MVKKSRYLKSSVIIFCTFVTIDAIIEDTETVMGKNFTFYMKNVSLYTIHKTFITIDTVLKQITNREYLNFSVFYFVRRYKMSEFFNVNRLSKLSYMKQV